MSDKMFESDKAINNITIPYYVKTIKDYAFYYCKKFESIKFLNDNPKSITVGRNVFSVYPLKNIYIPKVAKHQIMNVELL
nr:leucine-rich repeat protein [Brachyspira sp.]